ncbi:hypothetical protein DSO57_1030077 [Entomophthora muscae]|uniref:Uncharacterized protein n=1 Tax=Entomophthora muscae TaxID=34485 RepID=A0ACC2RS42_9FUNG|nr:hypothetical protein DSO57_1030077 [Entomophthora muscae]
MINWESDCLIVQLGTQLLAGANNSCGTLACCSQTYGQDAPANTLPPGPSAQFLSHFESITGNDKTRPLVTQKANYSSVSISSEGVIYFCTYLQIHYTIQLCLSVPPGSAPVHLVTPAWTLDLEFYHSHHLDLSPGCYRGQMPPIMKEISTTPPLPNMPPVQAFSKLGFIYITVLRLANQVMTHTRSWHLRITTANQLIRVIPQCTWPSRPNLPLLWGFNQAPVWGVATFAVWADSLGPIRRGKGPFSAMANLALWGIIEQCHKRKGGCCNTC